MTGPVDSRNLLKVWLKLGTQSFGGGGATITLMRRALTETHAWIEPRDFDADWALSQFAPGINLIAVTVLLGRRLAGARGVAICLFGLLMPSVLITILITAAYMQIRQSAMVAAALSGVIPASVGLGVFTLYQMAKGPLADCRKAGIGMLGVAVGVLVFSVLAVRLGLAAPAILVFAGLIGAVLEWRSVKPEKAIE